MLRTKTNIHRTLRFLLGTSMRGRVLRVGLVVLMVVSVTLPIVQEIVLRGRYRLDSATQTLIGKTNPNLAQKITFDAQKDMWQFNKDGIVKDDKSNPITALKSQLGGGGKKDTSLYSVDMPADASKGVTYYDNNTQLSFTLTPTFSVKSGKEVGGRLVYPIDDGAKLVYTAKNNGMKEDIVLTHAIGDNARFAYNMNLPKTLEAKLLDDGSVGIFSADPALFGNITFGSDADQAKVESARLSAVKDHLLFALPPPVIKQSGGAKSAATGQFRLEDGQLVVYANHLSNLTYPVTVDPSVIITFTSDFTKGNNESNIDFPANQMNRGGLTGGTVGTWASTNTFTSARYGHTAVAYNGYMYVLGGYTGSYLNTVQYAPINSNGTVGTWNTTTAFTTGRYGHTSRIYNGYIYVIGGYDGGSFINTVQYAPINSDGTVGAWNTTTAFTTARYSFASSVYNGYMYISGGWNGGVLGDVQYAVVNANGTVGAWNTTTAFTTARYAHESIAYNGYLYILAGYNGTTYFNTVQYAPINSNGTVGTWTATNTFTNGRMALTAYAANGYMYVAAGRDASTYYNTVQYAVINANGTVGTWLATSTFANGRNATAGMAYNGFIYVIGGVDGSGSYNDVQYVQINPAGVTASYTNTTIMTAARKGIVSFAYNGYLYTLGGGATQATPTNVVRYAPLNANGTVGTWNTTTAFTTNRSYFYAAAYNGFMYVCGGKSGAATTTNTCYYSTIASNGTVGAWTATSNFINARQWFGGAIYQGYMYIAGGDSADAGTQYNDVQYAAINAAGTLGAWHYTHNSTDDSTTFVAGFTNIRESLAVVASSGYLYVIGGWKNTGGAGTYYNDVQYAPLNANGTVGTWGTTASFTTTREDHQAIVVNGYLYVAGGRDSTNNVVGDVQYAPITANGTLGTWATTQSFVATSDTASAPRANFGMVYYAGYMYVIGGEDFNSTSTADVQYAVVNNGGAGALGSWTTDTSTFVSGNRYFHASVAYNGYMYVVGGTDGITAFNNVEYALINTNGSMGTWTVDTHTFANARARLSAVVYNGYMYIMGGINGGTQYKDVQYAPIGASGALTANFSATNDFDTTGRIEISAVAYNGYMYVVGGWDGTLDHADTRYAAINSNGTVGTWADSGNNFTTARSAMGGFAYNGYMYIVGGDGAAVYNDVQYAVINSNGTLGTWKATNGFNGVRQWFYASAYNGYVYLTGGSNNGTTNYLADTQYAPINANGTVGVWRHATALTNGIYAQGGAIYKGFLYTTGGDEAGGHDNYVQYAPLNVINRKGVYSKLMDFGSEYALSTISYNGTVPGGLASISVKTASSTATLGSASLASSLSAAALCSTGTNRYAWMVVTLDDSQTGAFPDSIAYANATDITVNYVVKHPDPNVRLRGGKYFAQEVLQPLDTCGP